MKQQQQKDVDFNFLSDKYNKLHNHIEKKSFKKIAFLGLSIGIGIFISYQTLTGLGTGITSFISSMHKIKMQQQQDSQNEVIKLSKIIKAIPSEDFTNFLAYMKVQQNLYDDKVALVSESIVKAEHEWLKSSFHGSSGVANVSASQELNNALTKHKKQWGDLVNQHQHVYSSVNNEDFKNININDVQSFIKSFDSYKANVTMHDTDLEAEINEKLFIDRTGNKEYNMNNKILEQIKNLDKNMEKRTSSIKPKI